jgi:hypothetical protein
MVRTRVPLLHVYHGTYMCTTSLSMPVRPVSTCWTPLRATIPHHARSGFSGEILVLCGLPCQHPPHLPSVPHHRPRQKKEIKMASAPLLKVGEDVVAAFGDFKQRRKHRYVQFTISEPEPQTFVLGVSKKGPKSLKNFGSFINSVCG